MQGLDVNKYLDTFSSSPWVNKGLCFAFSVRPETGRLGFDPRPGHTKDYKNGTQFLPAWRSASRVGLGCAVTMWLSAYRTVQPGGVAGSTPEPVDLSACLPPSLSPFPVYLLYYQIKAKKKDPKKILKRSIFRCQYFSTFTQVTFCTQAL